METNLDKKITPLENPEEITRGAENREPQEFEPSLEAKMQRDGLTPESQKLIDQLAQQTAQEALKNIPKVVPDNPSQVIDRGHSA